MAAAAQSPDVITVNLTATMFCDSSGASTLARGHRLAPPAEGVAACPPQFACDRLLELTGLNQILPVYRDVQQSLVTACAGSDGQPHSTA